MDWVWARKKVVWVGGWVFVRYKHWHINERMSEWTIHLSCTHPRSFTLFNVWFSYALHFLFTLIHIHGAFCTIIILKKPTQMYNIRTHIYTYRFRIVILWTDRQWFWIKANKRMNERTNERLSKRRASKSYNFMNDGPSKHLYKTHKCVDDKNRQRTHSAMYFILNEGWE